MATSQNLQSFDGLDEMQQQELPVAVLYQGRVQTDRGLHQEFEVSKKVGPGDVPGCVLSRFADAGSGFGCGMLSPADVMQVDQPSANGVIEDSSTGNFRLLSGGYKTQGVNVTLTEPLTQNMWVAVAYSTGAALTAKDGVAMTLTNASGSLRPGAGHDGYGCFEGASRSKRDQSARGVSVAAIAAGDCGQSLCGVRRSGVL